MRKPGVVYVASYMIDDDHGVEERVLGVYRSKASGNKAIRDMMRRRLDEYGIAIARNVSIEEQFGRRWPSYRCGAEPFTIEA